MKKYVLTSRESRNKVDLRDYDTIITTAVLDTVQDNEPLVSIGDDYFQVETTIPVATQEWAEINKILCCSELGQYQEDGQLLFTAIEEDKQNSK